MDEPLGLRSMPRYSRIRAKTRVYKLHLPPALAAAFEFAAECRQTSADALLHKIIFTLLRDNLIDAVIDDDEERRAARASGSPSSVVADRSI